MKLGRSVEGVIFGVIFDVGGTLIYSNGTHFEHANAWSAALTLRGWGEVGMRTIWQEVDARVDDEVQPDAVAEKPRDISEIISGWSFS